MEVRIVVIVICSIFQQAHALFKFTNIKCESLNKELVTMPICKIKAISRSTNELTIHIKLMGKPLKTITQHVQVFKRANGYRPWLYNITFDSCYYLRHQNVPVLNFLFDGIRNFSNINHTCPFTGDIIIKDCRLDETNLLLPIPNGDYMFDNRFTVNGRPTAIIQTYLNFINNNRIKD